MKIAVLGGGVAAFEAANAARKYNADAEIDMFSNEAVLPYRRPALSGLLADFKINEKMFFIKPESFYAENRINIHLNTTCTAVEKTSLLTSDGSRFEFDRLILATGGAACIPPLPGSDLANVCTLRSYSDLQKLDTVVSKINSAVIIGGGVLGLELAESLLKRQIKVDILEMNPHIFAGKLTPDAAAEVEAKLRSIPGLTLHFGVKVSEITADGAVLSDGRTITGETVIFSAGCRPLLPAALPAGLKTGRGIVVDSKMQTTVPGIYAAGDAAEFNGRCFGLYNDARTTGMIAGANAAGADEEFQELKSSPVRCFCFGLKLVMP